MRQKRLWIELTLIFLGLPATLTLFHAQRPVLYLTLWLMTLYGAWVLRRNHTTGWDELWLGRGWSNAQKRIALLRFAGATLLTAAFLYYYFPQYFLGFPRQKPLMWAMVMLLYPVLSVVAQEFVFRSFFFRRYAALFPQPVMMGVVNVACFGYLHIVLHNWVAPLLSAIGGIVFAYSYHQHQSLKWAIIEHAAYGCMIFTLGLGWFFFHGVQH